MKRNNSKLFTAIKLAAVFSVVWAFAACSLGGDTPQDLVRNFVSDIQSGSYSNIQSYLDSSASSYNTANTENYWTTHFPASGRPYSISSISGDGPVTAVIEFGGNNSDGTYEFTFSGSAGNLFGDSGFKIRTITTGSSTIFN